MTENDIIHSNLPHQVSIPEGSHVAVAKTSTPQEPSVHKNFRTGSTQELREHAPDRFAPEIHIDPASRLAPLDEEPAPERTDLAKTPIGSQREAKVAHASTLHPHSMTHVAIADATQAEFIPPVTAHEAQVLSVPADTKQERVLLQEVQLPDMDFPARVVHLRIENEELRTRLDKLETDH